MTLAQGEMKPANSHIGTQIDTVYIVACCSSVKQVLFILLLQGRSAGNGRPCDAKISVYSGWRCAALLWAISDFVDTPCYLPQLFYDEHAIAPSKGSSRNSSSTYIPLRSVS